ncbi:MBL fold metallo-hydrolase [Lysinibacillus sp. JNUCC-52]|uniref:MBL fold metallo-hydrolase n=1 Tax=Lysinibacillus sp. JNUCC-52 TaxID=2792480 RepID=UPI001937C5AC|nr:MBL fold metallo-hydrolase [Lysinibacillus sp. JNUCC-52]
MLKIEILGGVGEYGRNCFYLEKNGHAILLDCGVMNNREKTKPNLTPAHVAKLDAVFISHSHIDHVGALPLLAQWGYDGQLIMSEITAKQLQQSFQNIRTFEPASLGKWVNVNDHLSFLWGYSGHLIGSVWYSIRFLEEVIFFSGDYVMDSYLLKANLPKEHSEKYDVAFIDSGHFEKRIHNKKVLQQLADYIEENDRNAILFPSSFSGKTADIAFYLFEHTTRKVSIAKDFLPFFEEYYDAPDNVVFSPLLSSFKKECLQERTMAKNAIYFVPERDDVIISKLLTDLPSANVIFTGYFNKGSYIQQLAPNQLKHFFYKTHPDYEDTIVLSKYINAHQTIYFHSQLTNKETSLLKIIGSEDENI